jgi:hypothetical protein
MGGARWPGRGSLLLAASPRSGVVPHDASPRKVDRPRRFTLPTGFTARATRLACASGYPQHDPICILDTPGGLYSVEWEWPNCGDRPAKAYLVLWVGKPAGSVKRRGRRARIPDASCGTVADRGEAASSRLHRPQHLALISNALRLQPGRRLAIHRSDHLLTELP